MKISFVLATVDRLAELVRCLDSLALQSDRNFEVIVVDQNHDHRLDSVLEKYKQRIDLVHLYSSRGLSRSRNMGLSRCTGDVVAFTDDDCWYPPDLVERVTRWFSDSPDCQGLSISCLDENGVLVHGGRTDGLELDWRNVWSAAISFSIFLHRNLVRLVGAFDETLGLGANTPWGSGEETDYLLRALKIGAKIKYTTTIEVYHPQFVKRYDARAYLRGATYGRGMGRVIRKNGLPLWFFVWVLMRALTGVALGILRFNFGMAKFHWLVFRGRLGGWAASEPLPPKEDGARLK